MGRRPKTYTFHSRKARFKVYCASIDQQQALLQHILTTEGADSLRCAIVAPVVFAELQHPSSSANKRNPLLAPVLHPLAKLGRKRARTDGSDDDNASSSSDDDINDSDDDVDSDHTEESEGEAVGEDESEDDKDDPGSTSIALFPYNVYLEYNTAQARSSRAWGSALFEGFDKAQQLKASTPHPTSMFNDEQDNYIVDLMMTRAKVAEHGSPTLDETATLKLVTACYWERAHQDRVIKDIKTYCCGRGAAPSTFERIKKHWRQAHALPITPRAIAVADAVMPRLIRDHPFFPHKRLDKWAERFVGPGKSLSRLVYKPLVLWSKQGRIGKTDWARSLGNHIHIRGSLDAEKIHAGMLQGANVLILDNVKWHVLFNSDFGRALAEGQDSVSWIRKGGERVTTKLTVPVVILNNKKCKTWGPNNKKYWQQSLLWVRVRKIMFDESRVIDTDEASSIAVSSCPSASPSSSSPSFPVSSSCLSSPSTSSSVPTSSPSPSPSVTFPSPISSPGPASSPSPSLARPDQQAVGVSPPASSSSPSSPPSSAEHTLPTRKINTSNTICYGPDSYLVIDWLTREDADRQMAAWALLADQFVLMKHRGNPLARWKAFYCDVVAGSRTMYEYTSSELEAWEQHDWPPVGLQVRDAVREALEEDVNSLVANDYQHEKHQIGWHFDKRQDIAHGTSIATVSLGHARHFQLCLISELQRHRADEKARKEQMEANKKQGVKQKLPPIAPLADVIDVVLPHGSLFIIGPKTNALYEHRIPPSEEQCGRRFGLTFRTIASRWLPDAEVVILQPPEGKTAWDVMHRPKEVRKNGPIGQNGYAYRSRIFLEPYTPADPTRLTEADIIAVRASMPRPKLRSKPSRLSDAMQDEDSDEEVETATAAEADAGPGTTMHVIPSGEKTREVAVEPADPSAPEPILTRTIKRVRRRG